MMKKNNYKRFTTAQRIQNSEISDQIKTFKQFTIVKYIYKNENFKLAK